MANFGDSSISKPIQPSPEQQPTCGFHAELQTMGHAQLLSSAGAQPTECTTQLPNVAFTDSQATPVNPENSNANALKSANSADKASSPTSDVSPQTPVNPENPNTNALKSDVPAGQAASTAHDIPPQADLPVISQNSNANALRPSADSASGNAIQSTYEALDLDVRDYSPQSPAPDENQNQDALMNRIKNISAAKSPPPAAAATPQD